MNIIVQIYMMVCAILLVFDIFFLIVKNVRNQRYYPKVPKFEEAIRKEIKRKENKEDFSDGFLLYLHKKLKNIKFLLALSSVLEENPKAKGWFKNAVMDVIAEYQKKSDYEQAYYAYVVSTFDFTKEELSSQFAYDFLGFLDSKSLYTFCNTMTAIYHFGDFNLLLRAIDKVNERNGFYHEKLFVEGLLGTNVDKKHLAQELMQRYDGYHDATKKCILDFFRTAGCEASDFCMNIIQTNTGDDEIKYAAMRYFFKYPNEASKKYFMGILASVSPVPWVEEMMAIQGLESYDDEKIHNQIRIRITSSNWYIRTHAVAYLKKHGISKQEIGSLVYLKDNYANEALLYQYQDDKEMFQHISTLIEKLKKEEAES